MNTKLVKICNNCAIYRVGNQILNVEVDKEAAQILNYFNQIPANM